MYITYWNPPKSRQITFDQILAGVNNIDELRISGDNTSTMTVYKNTFSHKLDLITDVTAMIDKLTSFNEKYAALETDDLSSHYRHFEIPKKSGGWRPIDAPDKELSDVLIELRDLLKSFMIADYHTNAFAYIPNRSFIDAVRKHQAGHTKTVTDKTTGIQKRIVYENNWAVKFDFHGFFPSTTPEFVLSMMKDIYPFSLIMLRTKGEEELKKAIGMCFLRGGLPQGTPMSPWLTNVMMIPFDTLITHKLCYGYQMRDGIKREFTYTRYADDLMISCYLSFDYEEIQQIIQNCLAFIKAPFSLNEKKTHYGNRHSSKNWCLGLMWNQNNEITVGWRNLKNMKVAMKNYIDTKKRGENWALEDVQTFNGKISYYKMVEEDTVNKIIDYYNQKFGVDIMAMIKEDLRPKEGEVA